MASTTETDPFFSMCRHKIILVASPGCPVLAEKAPQGVLESPVSDHTLSDAKLNAFLSKNEWIHTIYRTFASHKILRKTVVVRCAMVVKMF